MSLADIDKVFSSGLWKNIETANVSGGEPTTRNDLVELCEVMLNRLPRLRKFAASNRTGMTPHRTSPAFSCPDQVQVIRERVRQNGYSVSAR